METLNFLMRNSSTLSYLVIQIRDSLLISKLQRNSKCDQYSLAKWKDPLSKLPLKKSSDSPIQSPNTSPSEKENGDQLKPKATLSTLPRPRSKTLETLFIPFKKSVQPLPLHSKRLLTYKKDPNTNKDQRNNQNWIPTTFLSARLITTLRTKGPLPRSMITKWLKRISLSFSGQFRLLNRWNGMKKTS